MKSIHPMSAMRLASLGCGLCTLFLCNPAAGLTPDRPISQYAHTAWRVQDGLIAGYSFALTQTQDGYLWIGTQSGILRFDGVRFVPWTAPDNDRLEHSDVVSLLGSRDGSLWIGTHLAGLWRWKDQHLTHFQNTEGIIGTIFEDRQGTVWFSRGGYEESTGGPLCQVIAESVRCYGPKDGIPMAIGQSITEDQAGHIWLGTDTGLVDWTPGLVSTYNPNGLKSNNGMQGITALAVGSDGSVAVGIGKSGPGLGLQQVVGGVLKPVTTLAWDSSSVSILALLLDRDGTLWAGTAGQGLYRIRAGHVDHFGAADGLTADYVTRLYEDHEHNLWVLTPKGLDSFRDTPVVTFSRSEGMHLSEIDTVLASRDGAVWAGGSGGLDVLRNGTISFLRAGKDLPGNQVTSLLEDHNQQLWVGIDQTLSIYRKGRFSEIRRSDGSSLGLVVGLAEDIQNDVWAEISANPRRLVQIRDLKVQQEFFAPQVPPARRVMADPSGGIWLGLMSGDLARFREGQLETFRFPRTAASSVNDMIMNSDGSVLGATAFGLIGWKSGTRRILTVKNGLPCDGINMVVSDSQSSLWLYAQCGLVRITNEELQRWWQDADATLQVRTFDASEGMQTGLVPFRAAARSSNGQLWFTNGSALQMIDPARLRSNTTPPPVHIEEVVADQRILPVEDRLHLAALTRNLSIRYTALSFVAPQKVRFRYKLEGHDLIWQDPGTRREAFYSDLGPGNYQFRVIASNNDGIWNNVGATLNFEIAPAWYQTISFHASCVAAFLLLLWALYRLRLHQLERQFNVRLEERVNERTRIARDLHDTLLQSFHGLLLRFQTVSYLLPAGEAKQRLDGTIDQAAEAITEGRDAVQGLRSSTVETTDLAVAIRTLGEELAISESGRNPAALRVGVEGTPRSLDPVVRDEVYRLAGEALRNAFQHAQARQIEMEIRYDDRKFRVRIRDDGKGIDPKILGAGGRAGHYGLHGMRERAKLMRGKLVVWSQVDSGTEVELSIPASTAYVPPARQRSWLSGKFSGKGL
jgi:signal transduction histidine kinase/ligand-binding sensor domain-containing protein